MENNEITICGIFESALTKLNNKAFTLCSEYVYENEWLKYDVPRLKGAEPSRFPYVLMLSKTHSRLFSVGDYMRTFFCFPRVRYDYARGEDNLSYNIDPRYINLDECIFLVYQDSVVPATPQMVQKVINATVNDVVGTWKAENGELPKYRPVDIKLHDITFTELKELIRMCQEHDDDSLMRCLKGFRNYARVSDNHKVNIYYNWRDNEFSFYERVDGIVRMCGGIIFHGWPETGYQENRSVMIVPSYGWSTHT